MDKKIEKTQHGAKASTGSTPKPASPQESAQSEIRTIDAGAEVKKNPHIRTMQTVQETIKKICELRSTSVGKDYKEELRDIKERLEMFEKEIKKYPDIPSKYIEEHLNIIIMELNLVKCAIEERKEQKEWKNKQTWIVDDNTADSPTATPEAPQRSEIIDIGGSASTSAVATSNNSKEPPRFILKNIEPSVFVLNIGGGPITSVKQAIKTFRSSLVALIDYYVTGSLSMEVSHFSRRLKKLMNALLQAGIISQETVKKVTKILNEVILKIVAKEEPINANRRIEEIGEITREIENQFNLEVQYPSSYFWTHNNYGHENF